MAENTPEIHRGLEGVYVAQSTICKVDGTEGRLYYRGYSIEELAASSSFEEVCYLLLRGRLPTAGEFKEFKAALVKERELPEDIIYMVEKLAKAEHRIDAIRTAISALPAYDAEVYDSSEEANIRKSIRLISKIASITAATGRFSRGESYTAPNPQLGHAANFLYMLRGSEPKPEEAKLLDRMLMLHAEHSSNASTFSTLVTGSTLADLYSAVVAGISTLKGPLHGGADEQALKMMREIGSADNTEKYIDEALAGKERIMGFGHRVYKTYDPRARIIKENLEELQNSANEEVKTLTAIALAAEKIMVERLGKTHNIWPNVDFFSGPIYTELGIEPELFTPLFAAARMPGWCAHMIEYWKDNRLFRPLEEYTGTIGLKYVPIESRE